MTTPKRAVLGLGGLLLIACGMAKSVAQAIPAKAPSPSIEIGISVPKTPTPVGSELWISVTVFNLTQNFINMPDWTIHIEGKAGEPQTTLRQRQWTQRLLPGDQPLRAGGYVPRIAPEDSYTQRTDATQLYKLIEPGRYTAYAETRDFATGSKVRTDTKVFEVIASAASETKKP